MKNIIKIAMLLLLAGSMLLAAQLMIEASNTLKTAKNNAVLAADWKALCAKNDKLTPQNARVLDAGGNVLNSQVIDNDGDGAVDELLFMANIAGNAKARFDVRADGSLDMPAMEGRAYARFVPERKDDYAWENDVTAFRTYGPGLKKSHENCGIDCWMKRVKYPIIDKWYKAGVLGVYHIDKGEGHDAYHVGDGLGCGGTAVWHNEKLFKSNVFTSWKSFSEGPLRAAFELTYGPWKVNGRQITEKKRVSIDYGKRLFRVDDSFFIDGKPGRLEVVLGLTNHDGKATVYEHRKKGYIYCWEKIGKYDMGTAIMTSPEDIKEYKLIQTGKKDSGHAAFIMDTGDDGKFTYYAGYGWEKAKEITTREQWENYLIQFIEDISNPVETKIR